jgi:uncharacterized protein YhjY with autotransporter beta-barrel domain
MRSCYSRAGLGRIGLAVTAIGVGPAHLAAQTSSDCLPPALASQLNEVMNTRRAAEVLTDNLDKPREELPQGLENALQKVTKVLNHTSGQAEIPAGQLAGLVCRLLALPENLLDRLAAQGAARSGVALLSAGGLTGAIMGRLDSSRGHGGGSSSSSSAVRGDGKMGLGAAEKMQPAAPAGSVGPLTVYGAGTFLAGNSADSAAASGFSYGGGSGMVGLEYSVNRNLILGLAGSFASMNADVHAGGSVGADVIHGAAYLSYATRAWFADALVAYGAIDLDLSRPGTSDTVRGSTTGGALAAAARTGYLFDLGKLRAGPIAGLTFIHARIDGYTETGNDPSTMVVEAQTVESLTGSAGLRFLAPFDAGGTLFVPYVNVTLEHHFGDGKAELTTGLTGAPSGTPPLSVSFPTFGARYYGKVEGGLTIELAPEASVSLSGASTFARDEGQDYRISAGLNYRF